jgi:hypothetical protein
LLYGAALVSAQQPKSNSGPDRALTETRKLLQAFGGTWSFSETYDPSDSTPQGGTGTGQEIWSAGPGERSVMEEYRSTNEHGSVSTGLGLGWWEEESGGFRLNWCSNDNPHGCLRYWWRTRITDENPFHYRCGFWTFMVRKGNTFG